MKRARFTEEQVVGILREREAGAATAAAVAITLPTPDTVSLSSADSPHAARWEHCL